MRSGTTYLPRTVLAETRSSYREALARFISYSGARRVDLVAHGYSQREADRLLTSFPTWEPSPGHAAELELPETTGDLPPGPDEVVALIASNDRARRTLEHRVYIRDRALEQPVRLDAAWLGTDFHQVVPRVHRIIYRSRLRSTDRAGSWHGHVPNEVAGVLDDPATRLTWPGPCDVFLLGEDLRDVIKVDVPLGYAGRGGIAGTRHHFVVDLIGATALKGLPAA